MKKNRTSDVLIMIALTGIGVMLILRQKEVSAAIIESLKNCVYRIIPSLFAMTAVSTAISRSGIVAKALGNVKIDANIFTAFIFGNIGGYPVGAKLLAEMVDDGRLNPLQAERALCFCYGSGPAFAAGVVGTAIYGDVRFGLSALLAGFSANLTLYMFYLIKSKNRDFSRCVAATGFSTKLMIDSVNSATGAMTAICSMILFFSAIKAILESMIPQLSGMKYFSSILEISNISSLSSRQGVSLVVVAVLLSFGGLCVQMQLLSIIGEKISVKRFYLTRLISLPLTAIYAFMLEKLLYALGIVSTVTTKIRLSRNSSLIPIICVLAMVFITLKEKTAPND